MATFTAIDMIMVGNLVLSTDPYGNENRVFL